LLLGGQKGREEGKTEKEKSYYPSRFISTVSKKCSKLCPKNTSMLKATKKSSGINPFLSRHSLIHLGSRPVARYWAARSGSQLPKCEP
jgi:hypothetical protein